MPKGPKITHSCVFSSTLYCRQWAC